MVILYGKVHAQMGCVNAPTEYFIVVCCLDC